MILDLSVRLINWGRCQRVYTQRAHCFSIEYMFRAPNPDLTPNLAAFLYERGLCTESEVETAYQTRQNARHDAQDLRDADTIEAAWRTIPDWNCKALLRLFYVKRRPPARIAQRLHVDFDRELWVAQAALSIELERKNHNMLCQELSKPQHIGL